MFFLFSLFTLQIWTAYFNCCLRLILFLFFGRYSLRLPEGRNSMMSLIPFPPVWGGKKTHQLLFSRQLVSNSSQPHGLQRVRLPCPSLSPRVCPSSCPLNQCCHPTISPSVALFSCPQSNPSVQGSQMKEEYRAQALETEDLNWLQHRPWNHRQPQVNLCLTPEVPETWDPQEWPGYLPQGCHHSLRQRCVLQSTRQMILKNHEPHHFHYKF